MSDHILLGDTRREAINRVQERLGPATSRPLAEQTFWALAKRGQITMDPSDGTYLIEAELEDESIKDVATAVQKTQTQQRGVQYNVNRNHFHRARVAYKWSAKASSVMSPSLQGSEGYHHPSAAGQSEEDLNIILDPPPPPTSTD
jgi:hypothetical protein